MNLYKLVVLPEISLDHGMFRALIVRAEDHGNARLQAYNYVKEFLEREYIDTPFSERNANMFLRLGESSCQVLSVVGPAEVVFDSVYHHC